MISAQEKTQSGVKGRENPGQASRDRWNFPRPTWNPEVTEPRASKIGRFPLDATQGRTRSVLKTGHKKVVIWTQRFLKSQSQASGDRLPSTLTEDDDMRNVPTLGDDVNSERSSDLFKAFNFEQYMFPSHKMPENFQV